MTSRMFALAATATVLASMAIVPSGAVAHGFGGSHWGGNTMSADRSGVISTMKSGESTILNGRNLTSEHRRFAFEGRDRDFFRWHHRWRKVAPLMLGPGPALPPAQAAKGFDLGNTKLQ